MAIWYLITQPVLANTRVWIKHLATLYNQMANTGLTKQRSFLIHNQKIQPTILISYRKRHFALSGHPLLYPCRVRLSPVWIIIQMLSLHSPALGDMIAHVRIQRQPIASLLRCKDWETETHTSLLWAQARDTVREGNTPHSLSALSASGPTHSHWHLHKRWRLAERF